MDSRTVYDKVINGSPLTDAEVYEGVEHFQRLETDLEQLGPVFRLSAGEVRRVRQQLQMFCNARERRKNESQRWT